MEGLYDRALRRSYRNRRGCSSTSSRRKTGIAWNPGKTVNSFFMPADVNLLVSALFPVKKMFSEPQPVQMSRYCFEICEVRQCFPETIVEVAFGHRSTQRRDCARQFRMAKSYGHCEFAEDAASRLTR